MGKVVSIVLPNSHKLWEKGISLSVYSRSYDPYTHEQDFTELGKMVHDFKYQTFMKDNRKKEIIEKCSEAVSSKLQLTESNNSRKFNCAISVPPNIDANISLPGEVSHYLASKFLWLSDGSKSISKVKSLPSMKTIKDTDKRPELLSNAYIVDTAHVPTDLKGFLIIDDIFESGSTLREICRTLKRQFPDIPRYVITITHLRGVWSQRR